MARSNGVIVESFAPLVGTKATVLVLGSMPGRQSLAEHQYYAHPRNAFWPLMEALFKVPAALPYAQRTQALTGTNVAVWDVLKACVRPGSLDADIEKETIVINDFQGFYRHHRNIKAVFFNGGAAAKLYTRHVLPMLDSVPAALPTLQLPSTSPAHAAMSQQAKADVWREALAPYF